MELFHADGAKKINAKIFSQCVWKIKAMAMSAKKTSFEDGTERFQGKVKWLSERRGYGFIEVDGDEVFIHRSALLAFGMYRLQNEDVVTVSLTTTERGQIVNCLFGVERPPIPPQLIAASPDEGEEIATVKFFNDAKGYGFIMIDGHDEDIFIHSRTLEDNGLAMLDTGQKILVRVGNRRTRRAGLHYPLLRR